MGHVRSIIDEVYGGHSIEKLTGLGITIIIGEAHFIDQYHISCNGKTISAKKIIIATGSKPFIPPLEGLSATPYLTNESLFTLDEPFPSSLIILGAGPIGIEMACLQRLGTSCTIVEMNDRILPKEECRAR